MLLDKLQKQIRAWYPLYANNTLRGPRRWVVRLVLGRSHAARTEYAVIQSVETSFRKQETFVPPSEVILRIREQVISQVQSEPSSSRQWQLWAIPLGLLIVAGMLLWQALPPVVTLSWSANGQDVQSFKVYRGIANEASPAEGDAFVLVEELPADSIDNTYTFTDVPLFPGNKVVYRIEAVDELGLMAKTWTLASNGVNALFGQLTLLVIVLFSTYVLWVLFRQWSLDYNPQWHVLT